MTITPGFVESVNASSAGRRSRFFDAVVSDDRVREIARRLAEDRGSAVHVTVGGGSGSAGAIVVGALAEIGEEQESTILYVVAHLDECDEAVDELAALGIEAARFPALEVLPGETNVSPELIGERLSVVRRLMEEDGPSIVVAPMPALMQRVPAANAMDRWSLVLRTGDGRGPGAVIKWLGSAGYERVESIEQAGEFAVRGGLIDVIPASGARLSSDEGGDDSKRRAVEMTGSAAPVRLDFFGDELESIREIDLDTMASDRRANEVQIIGASVKELLADDDEATDSSCGLWDILPSGSRVVLHEILEITEQGRGYYERALSDGGIFGPPAVFKALTAFPRLHLESIASAGADRDAVFDLPFGALPDFAQDTKDAIEELCELARDGMVFVICSNDGELERFRELLYETNPEAVNIEGMVSYLHRGFIWRGEDTGVGESISVVPYHELLHRYQTRRRLRRMRAGRAIDTFVDLQPGDYVVHRDHGIAKFVGLQMMESKRRDEDAAERSFAESKKRGRRKKETKKKTKGEDGKAQEYLTLEFAKGARLHVPAAKIHLIQKYVGGFDGKPPVSHLGGKKWAKQKEQVAGAVRDLAAEMLRLQAAREHLPGIRFPGDTTWQKQFEAEFPYTETDDQLVGMVEIKKDMREEQPMDRLLCGDVGFGKTELAIRAAFKAAEFGKQVAVLVPTTVLAEQHGRTFAARFKDYPFRVEILSRFNTAKKTKAIVEDLRRGRVDIAIGTHRLLSNDIRFADLGLVIIDEEQRFGVENKQRLLRFRTTADVLTLSATPIPRTLHMSLLGLRDISSLTTAPLDRRAIVTEVIPFNEQRIKRAIERELAREGQVYFINNRVSNIQSVADRIHELVPDARIIIGHGQMADRKLERVMVQFIRGDADILVATTIIESGIDIPNANTMFINAAENFGLANLHQLRGRVGRYKHRAYCYLMTSENKTLSTVAVKRLKAIEEYSMLGAGFKIAMRDLEIRGAGNLLGPEQSGHIAAVGYEMYCQLLEGAVHQLNNDTVVAPMDTEIELKIQGSIPSSYIYSDMRRMEAYRRISQCKTIEHLEKVERELLDAYGDLPTVTQLLLHLAEVRVRAAYVGVRSITRHENDIILHCDRPEVLTIAFAGAAGSVRLVEPRYPDQPKEIYFRPPVNYFEGDTIVHVLRRRLKLAMEHQDD